MIRNTARSESKSQEPAAELADGERAALSTTPQHASAAEASCCVPRALWGWSPQPLPAETALARRVDRFLPRTGVPCLLFLAAIVGLLNLAPHLPTRGQLGVDGLAFLAAGGWCGLNFWRCRHAHCLVSGAGWLSLSVVTFIEAGLGQSIIGGDEQVVFLGMLVLAIAFEGAWYLGRGTNAVTAGASRRCDISTGRTRTG